MKANEAPEKIWVHELPAKELNVPLKEYHIEYIRKDVFIEKACNLLARMIWEITYEDLKGDSTEHHDKIEFIEDFKNYLKED